MTAYFSKVLNIFQCFNFVKFPAVSLILLSIIVLQSCGNDRNRNGGGDEIEIQDSPAKRSEVALLKNVNFYLENSGSMNPYTKGSTDFNRAINTLLRDIDLLSLDTVKIYAANTKIHPLDQDLDMFISSLYNNGIPKVGNTNNSDLHLIFENLLDEYESGNISILVTDAIYSVEGTREKLLGNLEQKALKTRNYFYKTLQNKDFGTLCLKMSSNYDGEYYPAAGGRININQERPYYIWLFGDGKLLKEFSEKLKLFNLPGYNNSVYSVKNGSLSLEYSIVEHSVGNIGSFKPETRNRYPLHSIKDAEKASRGEMQGQFGFAVAVDFSVIPLPENHLLEPENYNITSEEYELYSITKIDGSLDPNARKYLSSVEETLNNTFTHLLFFKTEQKFLQSFDVQLKNEIPQWINETGIDDDSEIKGDTQQTFGFDKLISGILDAYNEVNKEDNIVSFRLTVK